MGRSEKADLGIAKRSRKIVDLGARLTATLTVRNDGPSAARGVVVTDPVSEGLRIRAASASAGSCEIVEGAVVCQLGDLAAGAKVTITVSATAVLRGRIDNAASVTASFPSDPDLTNNLASPAPGYPSGQAPP